MSASGVLLTAFGGPDCLEAVGPFMCNLMGREPSDEVLERARRKYMTIGGASPLVPIAESIAQALEVALVSTGPVPVAVGMRYSEPSIPRAMHSLAARGVTRFVTLSLSPFEFRVSSGAYREAVAEAGRDLPGVEVVEAPMLHDAEGFRVFLTEACGEAIRELGEQAKPLVVFTAHSLPEGELEVDDPYVRELRRVADEVARGAGLGKAGEIADDGRLPGVATFGNLGGVRPWVFAYQSKGARPGAWLGPDIGEVADAAAQAGYSGMAVCPLGFVTDHMETLYDLDVVVADAVFSADMDFARAAVPNDAPILIEAMVELVRPLL